MTPAHVRCVTWLSGALGDYIYPTQHHTMDLLLNHFGGPQQLIRAAASLAITPFLKVLHDIGFRAAKQTVQKLYKDLKNNVVWTNKELNQANTLSAAAPTTSFTTAKSQEHTSGAAAQQKTTALSDPNAMDPNVSNGGNAIFGDDNTDLGIRLGGTKTFKRLWNHQFGSTGAIPNPFPPITGSTKHTWDVVPLACAPSKAIMPRQAYTLFQGSRACRVKDMKVRIFGLSSWQSSTTQVLTQVSTIPNSYFEGPSKQNTLVQ